MDTALVLVLRPGIHCNTQNFGRCRKYSVIIIISATHGFYCYAQLNKEIRVTHSEIIETDQDLSGTGIKRPLQTSSSNPPPPAEGDDQEQPSTSDMPDAEELMELLRLQAPWQNNYLVSFFKNIFPLIPGLRHSLLLNICTAQYFFI